jgi:signal transduction histidine kinase
MPQMRLSEFILTNKEQILSEWESFARTLLPASQAMNIDELRDHAEGILIAIAKDLEQPQSRAQQAEKSKGRSDPVQATEAKAHGAVRAGKGFTLAQMMSEFRALRASVLRLWEEKESEALDVQELIRFNEAIDQAVAQSSKKFGDDLEHSKDLFLGILGHDLGNPLGAIMMASSQLLRGADAVNPSKAASRILRSSIRMKEIIGDLLDFTRTRLGTGMPISRKQVHLDEVCRDTAEEMRTLWEGQSIEVHTEGDLAGNWDGPRLGQVLSNLIGNAVAHGAKQAPITVTARGEPDQVVLTVHNWGNPIPTKHLNEIFLPLKRAGPDPKVGGMGLGLFIAKEIVVAHGGEIEVESTHAKGTTFTMHLPRQPAMGALAEEAHATH